MQVSAKVQVIVGVAVALLTLGSKGAIQLPLGIPADWGAYISSWSNFIMSIYIVVAPVLAAYSSSAPGPLAPADPPEVVKATLAAAAKVAGALAIGVVALGMLLAPGQARAASANPLQAVVNFVASDFDAAGALATGTPGVQDPNGKACWSAMAPIGAVIKAHPLPLTFHLATDLEAQRLFLIAAHQLCETPACNQVFNEHANAIASLGVGIPVFSLAALCAKIPPIGTTAATTIPATTPTPVATPAK